MLHHQTNYLHTVHEDRRGRMRCALGGCELRDTLAAAKARDPFAWSALVERFRSHVLRVARSFGLDSHQADDVAQETWLRLYRNLEGVRDPDALGAWLTTTARRESLRVLRRREPVTDTEPDDQPAAEIDFDDALVHAQRRDAVGRALGALPQRHRDLMYALMAEPALSYAEISDQLGIPVGSIGPIRGRCLARLQDELHRQRVHTPAIR
jgi:RNA polymerase sigma factor (sigma-70 family)